MYKFPITEYSRFSELPFDRLNNLNFSVYILDKQWNYLFINDAVKKNLGEKAQNLIGKNMWETFPELLPHPAFQQLRKNTENGLKTNLVTTSPINMQRINVVGYPMEDCTYFSRSVLPDKEDLINELRGELNKKK